MRRLVFEKQPQNFALIVKEEPSTRSLRSFILLVVIVVTGRTSIVEPATLVLFLNPIIQGILALPRTRNILLYAFQLSRESLDRSGIQA